MSIILNGTTGLTAPNFSSTQSTKIPSITATVSGNALSIGMSPMYLDFRANILTSGETTTISAAPANITVPSTATLGTVNGVESRLVVLAINNAGVVELAVVNLAGGLNLDETTLVTTAILNTGSTSNNVIYSTSARTSVPFRVVGFIDSTQVTAGTWASIATTIQGAGGQALAAMSSLGYGQTWQNVTASRAFATNYYNTTGKPIYISVAGIDPTNTSGYMGINMYVNGLLVQQIMTVVAAGGYVVAGVSIVPPGASYQANGSGAPQAALLAWYELR